MVRRSPLVCLLMVTACLSLPPAAAAASSRGRRQAGQAGVDYPTYSEVPPGLSFTCGDKVPGYYADPEAQCQVWHWCVPGGSKYSFLCPNQTLFNQVYRVCDWWFNVDCADSPSSYTINEDLYRVSEDASLGRELLREEEGGDSVVEESQVVEEEVAVVTEQELLQQQEQEEQEQPQPTQEEQQQQPQPEPQQQQEQEQQQEEMTTSDNQA